MRPVTSCDGCGTGSTLFKYVTQQLLISDRPAGPTASLSVDSGCFDAGSVEGLGGVTSTYAEPGPSGAG